MYLTQNQDWNKSDDKLLGQCFMALACSWNPWIWKDILEDWAFQMGKDPERWGASTWSIRKTTHFQLLIFIWSKEESKPRFNYGLSHLTLLKAWKLHGNSLFQNSYEHVVKSFLSPSLFLAIIYYPNLTCFLGCPAQERQGNTTQSNQGLHS